MSTEIDLDYANSLRLVMPHTGSIGLVLVGCGGTGSWLAPAVARVGKLMIDRFSRDVNITFYDPDQVEEKNIYRQNFCAAEIGRNKAVTLAERFGLAWGVNINGIPKEVNSNRHGFYDQAVIIGCVDNNQARRQILSAYSASYKNMWWLDCGNERNTGQILLGYKDREIKDPFKLKGICQWLPAPTVQHPELLVETPKAKEEESLSCAEMAMRDSQGLSINQRMAAEAADYLVRMLITLDLRKYATYMDLKCGSTKSNYITEPTIRHYYLEKND